MPRSSSSLCSEHARDPLPTASKATPPLRIDLRPGGNFNANERVWLESATNLLAGAFSQMSSVALDSIPDMDPYHKLRLQFEGVHAIEGIRIYVEPLETHHIEGRQSDLAIGFGKQVYLRSSQEYTRGVEDRRTVVGAIFVHRERIGGDELVFKRNIIHQLTHALGATASPECADLSVAFNELAVLGYEIRDEGLIELQSYLSIDLDKKDACLIGGEE